MENHILQRTTEAAQYRDRIRGCLFGGAAGDALGYPVEFSSISDIYQNYGLSGITEYAYDRRTRKALISDDTQMTLFTANGLLLGSTRGAPYSRYIALAYGDWYMTQFQRYGDTTVGAQQRRRVSWLCDVPELYSRRAPGNTCLNALCDPRNITRGDYIHPPLNNSKGCGGVMRVAPLALVRWDSITSMLAEAAQAAAVTHGHPLGYMTASVLCHMIHRIVFDDGGGADLKEIVLAAKNAVCKMFAQEQYIDDLAGIIDLAIQLSENSNSDLDNISRLGGGWVAEEALAIAIYCSLRYQKDFSQGLIAAVNHDGDSDSTGAITGNILGALIGYDAMDKKWKEDLELSDVIIELSDDLCCSGLVRQSNACEDPAWKNKYLYARRK